MNVRQKLGAVLRTVVILVVIAVSALGGDDPGPSGPDGDLTVVKGYGGRLKETFANDPQVAAILAERYGLKMEVTVRGSIELACGIPYEPDDDFVWLGDSVALEVYKACADHDGLVVSTDNVYNSPVVLYSWTPIVDALVAAEVARAEAGGAYSVDVARLVELAMAERTWADLGVPQLHGKVLVQTTDPRRSNSGFIFSGLLASSLNGGDVANATTIEPLLPDIHTYFSRLGYMERTSGELFEQFITTGMGAKPIIALYESQIPEFLIQHPSYRDQVSQQVRILYPRPTVWASHPFVARTENGDRLLKALKDPDIQRLAWQGHGQRPGVVGVEIDPNVMQIPGIMADVSSVIGMPAPGVMDRILAVIEAPPAGTMPTSAPSPPAATPPTPPG